MKAYLLKGLLLLSVIFGFMYWLDQRTMMKPDALEVVTTDSSSDREIASVTNNEITYDKAVNDLGNPKGPAMSQEAIREEALRKAAEASHVDYTDADDTNNSGFVPDPRGRLTKEQVSRYINILQISMSRLSSESQRLGDNSKALEAQFKQQSEQKVISLESYSHLYYQDLTNLSESIDKARKIHAEILASKNTSPEEYRWISGQVYQAFLLVANADLKKEHEIAKAYRLKKIQDISSDDYAKMESAYIAIFVSEMKQQSIDIKESLGKTTLDERLADYKKSQREEINRVYEDAYANPMDTEEIRANGKLVLPYKTIFLKAKNEYLIISL
jgi:hypothetical protein